MWSPRVYTDQVEGVKNLLQVPCFSVLIRKDSKLLALIDPPFHLFQKSTRGGEHVLANRRCPPERRSGLRSGRCVCRRNARRRRPGARAQTHPSEPDSRRAPPARFTTD